MYIFKNVMTNLITNRKRNILVAIIILILIISSTISIVINNTTKEITDDYANRFGSDVSIQMDMDKLNTEFGVPSMDLNGQEIKMENITSKQYIDFGKSDCLKSYTLKGTLPIDFVGDIKAIDEDILYNGLNNVEVIGGNSTTSSGSQGDRITGNVIFISDLSALSEFDDEQRKIIDGKTFNDKNGAIISKDLAELNNLKVGDKIKLLSLASPNGKDAEVVISGIFQDITDEYGGLPFKDPMVNKRNEVIMNINSDFCNDSMDYVSITGNYKLKNPDLLEKFKGELKAKGLPEIYKVTTDEASYNKVVAPVKGLSSTTLIVVVMTLIVGIIILLVIQSITVRERKYEIGVLRAIGMKKFKIIRMFIYENIVITCICLFLGFGIGMTLAQPVAEVMIDSQVKIIENNKENDGMADGGTFIFGADGFTAEKSDVEPLSDIDVEVSATAIIQIVLVAILLSIITSLLSVIAITKYEPMKILSERN